MTFHNVRTATADNERARSRGKVGDTRRFNARGQIEFEAKVMTGPGRISVHHISFNAEIRQTCAQPDAPFAPAQRYLLVQLLGGGVRRSNEGSGVVGRCNGRSMPLRINKGWIAAFAALSAAGAC